MVVYAATPTQLPKIHKRKNNKKKNTCKTNEWRIEIDIGITHEIVVYKKYN